MLGPFFGINQMKYTRAQMAILLAKAELEPRRNQKRYLHDLGGEGTAEELDQVLSIAREDKAVLEQSKTIIEERRRVNETVERGASEGAAKMLAQLRAEMEKQGLTQSEMAERCGWKQPLLAAYLSGRKQPGIQNLAKMAETLGVEWRLSAPWPMTI